MTRRITDSEAIRRINLVLDGREWSGADDLEGIAEVIRATGREIRLPVEDEQADEGERESFNVTSRAASFIARATSEAE